MKKMIYLVLLCTGLVPISVQAAQTNTASTTSYWTVETGEHQGGYTIVRFYSADHREIYTRTINGRKLQICKKQVRRKLDKELEKFVALLDQDIYALRGLF